jgi:hypothetical protein
MTRLLTLAAIGAALASPALAQFSDGGQNVERQRHSTVPPGGIYYSDRSGKVEPQDHSADFKWKANHKPKPRAKQNHSTAPRK